MSRAISLASAGGSITLDGSAGATARLKVQGTGAAPVQVQWFEGAGNGKSFRGGRTLGRTFTMPIKVYADQYDNASAARAQVRARAALVGRILALPNAPVRVTLDLDAGSPDGDRWFADMVKVGGGDWDWAADTDGRSFLMQTYTMEAGDPYWTSEDQDSKVITPAGVGIGLLGPGVSLAQLRVASTSGLGEVDILNTGEVEAYPVWRIEAPFEAFSLVSQYGETLEWSATKAGIVGGAKATGWIEVNTQYGTVVDEAGVNRYKGLEDAPSFWSVRPGTTAADILMTAASGASRITLVWNVRREILF